MEPPGDQLPADAEALRWSIRHAIELLDEAIDKMGGQLARSAGLYADSPEERSSPRPDANDVRRRARRAPVDEHGPPIDGERLEAVRGPELP
ncbi:hypothetical protein [Kribbella sp. VKM Ac-2571]|uniref:hypothetical protein n=1 Tax=Kribbella sp. VKM Ac-2571 TaxID=2512222 RepID=UPI001EDF0EEE|nr:hypothetical protein [Kribbella sp. VKM Ac-2571]